MSDLGPIVSEVLWLIRIPFTHMSSALFGGKEKGQNPYIKELLLVWQIISYTILKSRIQSSYDSRLEAGLTDYHRVGQQATLPR